jgi:hypothetical protein
VRADAIVYRAKVQGHARDVALEHPQPDASDEVQFG